MRKVALAFLSFMFAVSPAFANIHINPDTVVEVIKEHVPADNVNPVIREYNTQLKASNGTGIGASKLWNVCAAAGWNIKEAAGKTKCQTFVNALLKSSTIKYYSVCTADGKAEAKEAGATPYCIDNFFTNKNYGGIQVSQTEGIQLAKEYARIKHGDDSLQCKKDKLDKVKAGIFGLATDYSIRCTSKNKNAAYEFIFDDLKESVDKTHKDDVQKAVCKLYDAAATAEGCSGGGTNVGATTMICWDASCAADATKCKNINTSLNKFGYRAEYKDGKCAIDFRSVSDASELKDDFGIGNFVFCNGIQVQNNVTIETYLKQYVAQKAGVSESAVRCDAGFRTYTGKGCNVNHITDFKDDIKSCYVGSKQIDFVFNDINEAMRYEQKAGESGMTCIIQNGGKFDGKFCRKLTKQECTDANNKIPGGTDWDDKAGACVLKDARAAQRINNGITIATGVVITVGSFGVGAAAGAAVSGTTVLVAVAGSVAFDAAFIGLERIYEKNPHHRALQFMADAKNCKDSTCAYTVAKSHIARLDEIVDSLNNDELNVVSDEMNRTSDLLTNEQFVDAMLNSTLKIEDLALKGGGLALMTAGLFLAPEKAVNRVLNRAPALAAKMGRFATHIGVAGPHVDDIATLANRFGKTASWRQSSTLGKYYYRIPVTAGENTDGIVRALRENGWYISSNATTEGEMFIAASKTDIFGPWAAQPTNWLRMGNSSQIAGGADNIETLANRFGKTASWRQSSTLGGQYYYRIPVTAGENTDGIVRALRENGWYVSSNITTEGEMFIAASKTDIFGPWAAQPTNWLTGSNSAQIARAERAAGNAEHVRAVMKSEGMEAVWGHNAYVSGRMSEAAAEAKVASLQAKGYPASRIGVEGTDDVEIVISMTAEEATRIGAYVMDGAVYRSIDNSANMAKLHKVADGRELGRINGKKVSIESIADFGTHSGRPIIMVDVGGRKIPFYASSGRAGKTEVPTGKWEFFGGIGSNGWFNKGRDINSIVNHYNSPELQQIAHMLDTQIGDLRNTEFVLESIGRESLGGLGKVASLRDETEIAAFTINKVLKYAPASRGTAAFYANLDDIKNFLSGWR